MNPGRNPIVVLILNYAVGYMVASGQVTPDSASELVNQIADVIGLGIIFITSLYSLYQYFKTHKLSLQPTVQQEIKSTTTITGPTPLPTAPTDIPTRVESLPPLRENPSGLPPEMLPPVTQNP